VKNNNTSLQHALQRIKDVAHSFLMLEDDNFIDAVLAAVLSIKLNADPLWLFLIAPSSSGKTEILRALDGHKSVYFLSSFTRNTLISGYIPKDDTKQDPSLLHQLNGKVIIAKDFTTVLQMRREDRQEIFAQLREVYDGMYDKAFGTGERKKWRGKVGFIAGVTPAIERHRAVNQSLGERYIYYHIDSSDPLLVAQMAQSKTIDKDSSRKELKKSVHAFLDMLESDRNKDNIQLSQLMSDRISNLAVFCSTARTSVDRDPYNKIIETMPDPEGPGRLVNQLSLLGICLAMVRGIDCIDEGVFDILRKVACDSIPSVRLPVIKALLATEYDKWASTSDIVQNTGMPPTTVRYQLEELPMLGLAFQEGHDRDHTWKASDQLLQLVQDGNIFIKH